MSVWRFIALLLVATGLAGCGVSNPFQPQQRTAEEQIWLRTDGQSGRTNPALAAQFDADRAACTVTGGIDRACMTRRGYILVPQSQAEATAARLRSASSAPN
jgi:hypothetical protein